MNSTHDQTRDAQPPLDVFFDDQARTLLPWEAGYEAPVGQTATSTPTPVAVPAPTAAADPVANLPVPEGISGVVAKMEIDAVESAKNLLGQMLREATPQLEQRIVQYATAFIDDVIKGHTPLKMVTPAPVPDPVPDVVIAQGTVDIPAPPTPVVVEHPIIGTQKQYLPGKPAVNAATTAMLRGLTVDVGAAVALALSSLANPDFFTKGGWVIIGSLVGKTVIQTVWKFFSTRKAVVAEGGT